MSIFQVHLGTTLRLTQVLYKLVNTQILYGYGIITVTRLFRRKYGRIVGLKTKKTFHCCDPLVVKCGRIILNNNLVTNISENT